AAPEDEADGPLRPAAHLRQDARALHRRGGAGAVVGAALRLVPAVEVAADDHRFVRLLAAGDLGDHVVELDRPRLELAVDFDLAAHRLAAVEQLLELLGVVVLHDDLRHLRHVLELAHRHAVVAEHAHAVRIPGVALRAAEPAEDARLLAAVAQLAARPP